MFSLIRAMIYMELIFFILGYILGDMGYYKNDWQFWIIPACAFAGFVVGAFI